MADYIGVATGLIGLATAWLGYRASVRRSITNAERRMPILAFDDPTVRIGYWKPKRTLWMQGVIGILYLSLVAVWFGWTSGMTILAAAGLGLGMVIVPFLRKEPPSRVMRSASIVIAERRLEALRRCIDVLRGIRARIARVDEESGLIQARIPMSVWSWGHIISINVASDKENRSEVRISSDSMMPSIVIDFGANARVVRNIVSRLFEL
jgi:hypothetical protein